MEAMKFRTRVGPDGILQLEMPDELWGQEIEAIVVLQPVLIPRSEMSRSEWLKFIDETSGSLADDPIERDDQGEHEIRDEIV
ncbi:MAG: hypothetical protein HND46_21225 [Chloroflexi bacterium]|nr:hypothetical protein [Chloroflexota bacterium]NOG65943.1 hypothetical protein [Chloroflexota bacterium]